MSIADKDPYPGDHDTVDELLALADSYWRSARQLNDAVAIKGKLETRMPAYLCGIHSIELYLAAYLRHEGLSNSTVRGYHHDFASRVEKARASGFNIDARTAKHLSDMTECREYLVCRYGPEQVRDLSPVTRLFRSIENVASATYAALGSRENAHPS